MNEETLQQQVDRLQKTLNDFLSEYNRNTTPTTETFTKKVYFKNGTSFNNSSIGGATDLISVYGVAPVAQAGAITNPSGGATIDSQARTAIASIITALKNFGITA